MHDNTGRFVMSSVIINIYNKKTKGPTYLNLLTPNVNDSVRTAPLTSKVAFYIFIQQI